MVDITANAGYTYGTRVYKDFKIEHIEEHHDSYVQSDTLLLADVFENFRNTCVNIYKLDRPCLVFHCTRISMAGRLKKEQSKIRTFKWFYYVISRRKWYKRRNMTRYS